MTVFDTNLQELVAFNIGNPQNGEPKAIGIVTECCPEPIFIDTAYVCFEIDTILFLQSLLGFAGTVAEGGSWSPESANAAAVFDLCDNSVTIDNTEACYTFSLSSDGTGANNQCGAFDIELTVCVESPSFTPTPTQGTCNGTNENNDAIINLSSVIGDEANVSLGATYTGPAYGDAGNVSISNGVAQLTGLVHNTEYTVRVFSGGNGCFVDETITTPSIVCNAPCNLTDAGETAETCNDNSTGSDPSDDYITFSLNPIGSNLGATYSVTANNGGTVTLAAGGAATGISYNTATAFRLQDGSADGATNFTITVTDVAGGGCSTTTMVMQNSCSGTCNLTDAGETAETCNDNSTGSDPSDDYITFSLNPVGANLGATYSVTANNGGTVTLAAGGAATGISYNTATAFRLQNGSADGATNFTITVTDVADGGCTTTTMVMQNSCSGTCNLTDAGETAETCNDNSTGSDPSDDYITFSLNPVGSNLGATYSVTANNGGTVTLAGGGAATGVSYNTATAFRLQNGSADGATNFTITVTDVADGSCQITATVMQNACSDACILTITQNDQSVCQDNGTTSVDTDDYFTIDVNATASNGGAQYQVVMGANPDGTGGTVLATSNYGIAATVGTPTTFDTDGTTIYTITVRDALDNTCHDEFTTTAVNSCNSCPSITNPTATQTICEGQTIATLSTNTDASSDIEFVYFTTPQTGNAVYAGGTNIQVVSPIAGTASISNVADFTSAGTYYVYARLSPTPVDGTCRPSTEIIVTVNPLPDLNLMVSDTTVCDETDGIVFVFNSEIGVTYQLRNDSNDNPIGSPIAGTGSTIELPFMDLTPVGTQTFNIFASNGTTGCEGELTDKAVITIQPCDFDFPFPTCQFPPCHFISTDIYLGATVTNDNPNTGESGADDGIIRIPNNIRPSITVHFPVTVYNNTGNTAYLSGWIDWNGDGDFEDAGEQIAQETYAYSAPNTGSFVVRIPVNVPSNAVQATDLSVRWRLSTDPSISFSPCGVQSCAADGEVEDYLIQVECPPVICLPVGITINRN